MNSSKTGPTKMDWVEATDCDCPQFETLCLRPSQYSKPRLCVHAAHVHNITNYLLAPPCSTIYNNDYHMAYIGSIKPSDVILVAIFTFMIIIQVRIKGWI